VRSDDKMQARFYFMTCMFFVSVAFRGVRFDISRLHTSELSSIRSSDDGVAAIGKTDHLKYRISRIPEAHNERIKAKMPEHVAFIVDGNGRWAEKQGLPRSRGHAEGANVTVEVVKRCFAEGVDTVTLYLFSTENWKRPVDEVLNIMYLLEKYLKDFRGHLQENDIILKVIGQTYRLPKNVLSLVDTFTGAAPSVSERINDLKQLHSLQDESNHLEHRVDDSVPTPVGASLTNSIDNGRRKQKVLCLAISYGGRDDIVHAARGIAERVKRGDLSIDQVTEEEFAKHTMTGSQGIQDPDVIIRTSGENRLSNFLLWQCAYSEFVLVDKLWPDFSAEEAITLLSQFAGRKRRYGGIQGGPQ
jgi:undecaprenyl diphosphate synthase